MRLQPSEFDMAIASMRRLARIALSTDPVGREARDVCAQEQKRRGKAAARRTRVVGVVR